MRILFAGLALPYPPMNGHRLRTWAMLRALAEYGHEVTCVVLAEPHELSGPESPLREACREVELVPIPQHRSAAAEALARLRALASPWPFPVHRLRTPALTRAIERRLASGQIDLLICDGIYNVQNLPPRVAVPVVLNKDDVAHVILERYLRLEPNPARRLYGALEARKVRRWEQVACARMRAILACSELDRRLLEALCPGVPIHVVPNVVDTDHYAPSDAPTDPFTVLFQGGMDWYPNRDAVAFFAREILPRLRRLVPEVVFRVAGRSPSQAFRRRLADVPGLEFTGTVPDMRTEIARATVCVVPLRIGSGTRLKILEAGAMAKAVVSTTLGVEGLDLRDGKEIIVADEPLRVAVAIASLLADPRRRGELGQAARLVVRTLYSFEVANWAMRDALTAAAS